LEKEAKKRLDDEKL
jgi:hypothetical protein